MTEPRYTVVQFTDPFRSGKSVGMGGLRQRNRRSTDKVESKIVQAGKVISKAERERKKSERERVDSIFGSASNGTGQASGSNDDDFEYT